MRCCAWKCGPTAISSGVDIPAVPGCHYVQHDTWVLSEIHTGYFKDLCLLNSAYLSNFCLFFDLMKLPYYQKLVKHNFESHNSLEVSFTNMRGLYLNFVECESFSESNFPDILALDETNLNWLWHTYAMVMVMVIMVMLLNCMVLQFIWTRGFFLHGTYL